MIKASGELACRFCPRRYIQTMRQIFGCFAVAAQKEDFFGNEPFEKG